MVRSRVSSGLVAAVLGSSCLLTFPCRAADAPSSVAEWVRRGVEAFKREDYDAARIAFAHAYDSDPKPSTLVSLALAELQSGHPVEAVRHLRAFVKDPAADPAKIGAVQSRWLPRAEQETARVAVVAPAGASVTVDGHVEGTAPLVDPIDVNIGEHDVAARLDAWQQSTHVSAHSNETVQVKLEIVAPPPSPPAASPGSATPTADGPTSPERPVATAGASKAKVVTVISLGTGAVISAALGVVLSLDSRSEASIVTGLRAQLPPGNSCPAGSTSSQCVKIQNAGDTENREYWEGMGLYIAGGALAGAALVTLLVWPNKHDESAWWVRPTVERSAAGVAVGAAF